MKNGEFVELLDPVLWYDCSLEGTSLNVQSDLTLISGACQALDRKRYRKRTALSEQL